ncbi:GspE/PulE family protein [Peptoniphilus catoniae]|uniref:GspE/PulE family protein n=1 Tax=Peptoniphilus catoniae TaxID=1660341 RepID=UPI0010FE778D|nr:GspE/PulE family protein [Peptoniphilus catoniae]
MNTRVNDLLKIVNKNISLKYNVVPKAIKGDLVIFWTDEFNQNTDSALRLLLGRDVSFDLCEKSQLNDFRQRVYSKPDISSVESILGELSQISSVSEGDHRDNSDSKIARLLNKIIEYAVSKGASDIHIDSHEKFSLVRIRLDGNLNDLIKVDKPITRLLVNRIKVLCNLDYTVKNIPQDGRFTYNYGDRKIDIRVAVTPTIYSEKIVLRILNREVVDFTREGIGLKGEQGRLVDKLIRQPNGLILSVGPTGSGKSTTLITLLKEIKNPDINIVTIEDPVEYRVEGINQIEINEKSGLDFNLGLKSILRLDPDKIMVGEIRDAQTAETALRASITGHLVLSTLHTNDSPSAIYRLRDMGVENYLISAGVIGIISQRLVRKLCDCKIKERRYVDVFGKNMDIYRPGSCEKCNNGYRGRVAVYEVLIINDELREAINNGVPLADFKKLCLKSGMISLKYSMEELLENGITSLEEVYKNIVTIGEI